MISQLKENLVLDGYRLIRFLGEGGFGEVWLCRSEAMGDYRALKLIPSSNPGHLEKEYAALQHYRSAAAKLRSPHLVSIEHVNRIDCGLYYVMPLADGLTAGDPADSGWKPLSIATKVQAQESQERWFSSQEIVTWIKQVLYALQTLSNADLVHRDVKPDNVLFFNGLPCLGDISLLGEDAAMITRRGTPGYGTPSWYVGGHPDMYGVAATLYTLLTGNAPDKMGRAAFLWPPQGELSLSEHERAEWKRLHGVIRRATEEKVSERFVDFTAMADSLDGQHVEKPRSSRMALLVLSLAIVTAVTAAILIVSHKGNQKNQDELVNVPGSDDRPAPVETTPASKPLPELTDEEKADYRALAGMVMGYLGDGEHANALSSVDYLLSTYPQSKTQPAYSIARAMALIGLNRMDEAKDELRKDVHLSPKMAPLSERRKLWIQMGELEEAENDLSRILDQFGPNTLVLFLRADVRAQRENFEGAYADKQLAYKANPKELDQRRLVDSMWAPLAKKYPDYGRYAQSKLKEKDAGALVEESTKIEHDDKWVCDTFNSVVYFILKYGRNDARSSASVRARAGDLRQVKAYFKAGIYQKAQLMLDTLTATDRSWRNTPSLSLLRSLLLARQGRFDESDRELGKLCHRQADFSPTISGRIALLNALNRRLEARDLLTRMVNEIPSEAEDRSKQLLSLLSLRARMNAILGEYSQVQSDYDELLKLSKQDPNKDVGEDISDLGEALEKLYPSYQSYIQEQTEK